MSGKKALWQQQAPRPLDRFEKKDYDAAHAAAIEELISMEPSNRAEARRMAYFLIKTVPTLRVMGVNEFDFARLVNSALS